MAPSSKPAAIVLIQPAAPVRKTRVFRSHFRELKLDRDLRRFYGMESTLVSRSSILASDPLSDVLSLVKTRGYMSGGLDFGGNWSYAFAADSAFRCFAIVSGQCWLSVADGRDPILLREGEFFALPHGHRFSLASDPAIDPGNIYDEVDGPLNGRVLQIGGGGNCCLFGTIFTFRQELSSHLLNALPEILHIDDGADRYALKAYLDRMMALLRHPQPRSVLVAEYLAETMLVEVLRLHLAQQAEIGIGWLFALSDKRLNRAVTAIHEQPGHRWSVRQLAERAGMSRSAFAFRFKEKVGVSVMDYVVQWRMMLAADRLLTTPDTIANIASNLGYDSESAFVFAFRREMGCTPRQYSRRAARGA